MNRPRNILLQNADPRQPVSWEFQHSVGGFRHAIAVHQTPAEATWPGGALWDCGVLLGELLLAVAGIETLTLRSSPLEDDDDDNNNNNKKTTSRTTNLLATRFRAWMAKSANASVWTSLVEEVLLHRTDLNIVELGCGVGLTGLVASVALGAATTILTDLTVVVQDVTQKNVLANTQAPGGGNQRSNPHSHRIIKHCKGGGKVLAASLCWGKREQGDQVLQVMRELRPMTNSKGKGKKKKTQSTSTTTNRSYPDLVLLGDVAYQHKPGAPSHFDILVESLLQLMPPCTDEDSPMSDPTLLIFGTRLRMPASMDLLLLLNQHFTPVLPEPIPAEVLDPALRGVKHNMTIHIFTNQPKVVA